MAKLTEICLYGDIGDTYWFEGITANDVRLSLKELDPKAAIHTLRINSTGGRVDEGLAIMNIVRAHKAAMKVSNPDFSLVTVVDGYCMSAATLPMMAGNKREIALGGIVMIHDAWAYSGGNAAELRKQADDLDKLSDNAATIYAQLSVPAAEGAEARDNAYFRKMMAAETYLTGEEAVACGMATCVDKALEASMWKGLTPETMKGHYVEIMTKRPERRTYNRATNTAAMLERKKAIQELEFLAIELGVNT